MKPLVLILIAIAISVNGCGSNKESKSEARFSTYRPDGQVFIGSAPSVYPNGKLGTCIRYLSLPESAESNKKYLRKAYEHIASKIETVGQSKSGILSESDCQDTGVIAVCQMGSASEDDHFTQDMYFYSPQWSIEEARRLCAEGGDNLIYPK